MNDDTLTGQIIGAAIDVHRALGPGLLESAYEACLRKDLLDRGLLVERQKPLPLVYKGERVDCGYRIDLFVNRRIVVELKCVDRIEPVHQAQILSYLRLAGVTVGLIINFKMFRLVEGIRRVVLDHPEASALSAFSAVR